VDGNSVWAPLGVCNVSTGFSPSNWLRNVTSRIRLPKWHNSGRTHANEPKENRRELFQNLKEANLNVNPEKSQFLERRNRYSKSSRYHWTGTTLNRQGTLAIPSIFICFHVCLRWFKFYSVHNLIKSISNLYSLFCFLCLSLLLLFRCALSVEVTVLFLVAVSAYAITALRSRSSAHSNSLS